LTIPEIVRLLVFCFTFAIAISIGEIGFGAPIEGFGATASGGSNPCVVTSLADPTETGKVTLRDCLRNPGNLVTFSVGGVIQPLQSLDIPSLTTLDGALAPSPGITLDGSRMSYPAGSDKAVIQIKGSAGIRSDILIRSIRIVENITGDGIEIWGVPGSGSVRRVAIDQVTLIDCSDENISVYADAQDVTVQWSLIGYTVNRGIHPYSMLVAGGPPSPQRISIHHNLFVYGDQRNPQVDKATFVDVRNNVVRHWTNYGGRFRDGAEANFVANDYYTNDSSLGQKAFIVVPLNESSTLPPAGPIYVSGNLIPQQSGVSSLGLASVPYSVAAVTTDPADTLEARLLPTVGSPIRDAVDRALIEYARVYTSSTPVTPTPTPTSPVPTVLPTQSPSPSSSSQTVSESEVMEPTTMISGGCGFLSVNVGQLMILCMALALLTAKRTLY